MHSKQLGLTEAMRVEKYFERPYVKVKIQPGPVCEALVDSGAEVCGISQKLCQELNLPSLGTERIKGWNGQVAEVDATWVTLTQGDKAATPGVRVWCAVVPNASEPLIINPGVVEQLKLVTPYVVPAAGVLSASGSLVNLGTFYNVDAPHGQCQERYNKIQNRDVDDEKDDEVCEFNNCKIDGSAITNKIQNRDVDDEKDDEVCEFNNCKLDGSVITNKIQNRDVDDEKDDEVCEVNNCKIDGSIITNKIQNRDVDDEKDDEVCEFNNCKLDGSVITNKIQNRDVDDEKDDEVCEFNNCKIDDSVVVDGVPNRDVDEEKDDEGSEKSCKVMIKDIGRADISQEKKDSAVNKINKYKFELGEVGSSGIGLVDRSNVVGRDVNYVVRVAEMTIDGRRDNNHHNYSSCNNQLFQQLQLNSVVVSVISTTPTQQRQGNNHLSYNNSYPATSCGNQLFQQQLQHNSVVVSAISTTTPTQQCQGNDHLSYNNSYPATSWPNSIANFLQQCFDKFYKIINSTYSWYYPASNITLRSSDPSFISPFIKFLLRQKNKLMRLGFTVKAAAITKYISKLIINFNSKTFTNSLQTFHALKKLRSHGLRGVKLFDITESLIISRIKYAAPSWSGFATQQQLQQLQSLIKKLIRFNYLLHHILPSLRYSTHSIQGCSRK
ncbi:hypothetical protein HELRODRAFT_181112 [Helobdella robusta]|uniref:Uncharacterized protein n=1 Tax=Helobdella robusta TaxID=6412 RepID=T1FGM4_HELRO|nr:hypothetical protein HELRODRAFT_181112 [Helobdella robusta]ESN93192.1 hypothetical protein HELRODRAFT_181112 [Helobdella robusta]